MPFTVKELPLGGLLMIEPKVFSDDRGFFIESFKESDFIRYGIRDRFVQDNHSLSRKNVLRGLHFQRPPKDQGKLVRVVAGSVWDVAVDIRKESPTCKKWYGVELSGSNKLMLYIPPGFAHGFVALTDNVHLVYKCTEEYDPDLDTGIRWNDPELAIDWPVKDPFLSPKDEVLPFLNEAVRQ